MYSIKIEAKLERILRKLYKKDRKLYKMIINKIQEIIKNPYHYKPLRYDMKEFRRVHIMKSFVLIFRLDEKNQTIKFEDFDHHDRIYKIR